MKLRLLTALVVAAGLASTAHAATTYTVNGAQNLSLDLVDLPVEEGGLGGTLTQDPNPPVFNGSWSIDPTAPSLAGSFVFAPYTVTVDMMVSLGAFVAVSIPDRVLTINGGVFSYDAATRTLTGTSVNFSESSPGATCDEGGILCALLPDPGSPGHGDLQLVFGPDLLTFTGAASVYIAVDNGFANPDPASTCRTEGGINICSTGILTFAGVAEVPVPAAAWLFGSAVLGLGTLKRRKAA
jgi:hypothetical protein